MILVDYGILLLSIRKVPLMAMSIALLLRPVSIWSWHLEIRSIYHQIMVPHMRLSTHTIPRIVFNLIASPLVALVILFL